MYMRLAPAVSLAWDMPNGESLRIEYTAPLVVRDSFSPKPVVMENEECKLTDEEILQGKCWLYAQQQQSKDYLGIDDNRPDYIPERIYGLSGNEYLYPLNDVKPNCSDSALPQPNRIPQPVCAKDGTIND